MCARPMPAVRFPAAAPRGAGERDYIIYNIIINNNIIIINITPGRGGAAVPAQLRRVQRGPGLPAHPRGRALPVPLRPPGA